LALDVPVLILSDLSHVRILKKKKKKSRLRKVEGGREGG
jgi:hypothetical protein